MTVLLPLQVMIDQPAFAVLKTVSSAQLIMVKRQMRGCHDGLFTLRQTLTVRSCSVTDKRVSILTGFPAEAHLD